VWLGLPTVFGPAVDAADAIGLDANAIRQTNFWVGGGKTFPGLGKEFMPPLDEGSFLYMPTTMVHASIAEALDVLATQDRAFRAIPEVDMVVGKIGRVDSPLDPAPISMVETIITYKSEYGRDKQGNYVRQWRDKIRTPDDIWQEIVKAGKIPGSTSAPKLQPIETRLVMLQTGMRAPMGIKIRGPDLQTIERVGLQIEKLLRQVDGIESATVNADRIVGKPYIIIDARAEKMDQAMSRYGLNVEDVLRTVEVAVGGQRVTTTVEGRQRFGVRVRYQRELRDDIDSLGKILVAGKTGQQVPLAELVDVGYERGPQVIKSEDTFKVGYVTFGKKADKAEVDVVEEAEAYLEAAEERGELTLPAGVTYKFTGTYESQLRAQRKLFIVMPMALLIIFVILYLQFRSTATTLMIFMGIFVAFAGGFLLLWLYNWLPDQGWFAGMELFGRKVGDLFQVHKINMSTAIWVGFLALFGIATDDGVVMGTYLRQTFRSRQPATKGDIHQAVVEAGTRRVRPCLMTTATTILALLPVLTSTGRGSDIMVPMALPAFGGMTLEILTMLVVPVLFCLVKEFRRHTGWSPAWIGALLFFTGMLAIIPMLIVCAVADSAERSRPTPKAGR
jgi:Cu(I)/Ag(I) efflux system membrane protein CusA/SilA